MPRNDDTPFTRLIMHIVASDDRTRRTIKLLAVTAVILLVLLAAVAVIAALSSPTVAAVTGGVPVASAGAGAVLRQLRGSRRTRMQQSPALSIEPSTLAANSPTTKGT
jgi:hypothetical protein